jgi:hypothetical protein
VFTVLVKVVLGRGFLRVLRFSLISIILPMFHSYLHLRAALSYQNKGAKLMNLQIGQCFSGN